MDFKMRIELVLVSLPVVEEQGGSSYYYPEPRAIPN
jgi:hypothetical protein